MIIERLINWIKRLFGYHNQHVEIDYDYEELPPHVKEFMKKRVHLKYMVTIKQGHFVTLMMRLTR